MPQLKWVAKTGEVCDSEAEALEIEQRCRDLRKVDDFLDENHGFSDFCFHIEETLTGAEFLKVCLRLASKKNPYITEVFGDGFKESLIHFLK